MIAIVANEVTGPREQQLAAARAAGQIANSHYWSFGPPAEIRRTTTGAISKASYTKP